MKHIKLFKEATDLSEWKFDKIRRDILNIIPEDILNSFSIRIGNDSRNEMDILANLIIEFKKKNKQLLNKYLKFNPIEIEETIKLIDNCINDRFKIKSVAKKNGNYSEIKNSLTITDTLNDSVRIIFIKNTNIKLKKVDKDLDISEIFIDISDENFRVKAVNDGLGAFIITIINENNVKYTSETYDKITSSIEKCMLYDLELHKIIVPCRNLVRSGNQPLITTHRFNSVEEWDSFDKTDLNIENTIKIVFKL